MAEAKLDYLYGHDVKSVRQSKDESEGIEIKFTSGAVIVSTDARYLGTAEARQKMIGQQLIEIEDVEEEDEGTDFTARFGHVVGNPPQVTVVAEIKLRSDAIRIYHPGVSQENEVALVDLPDTPEDRTPDGPSEVWLESQESAQEAPEAQREDRLPSES